MSECLHCEIHGTLESHLQRGQNAWELLAVSPSGESIVRDPQSPISLSCLVIRHVARPSTPTGSSPSAGAGLRPPIKRNSSIMSFRIRRNAK
jgi:hypothetical protein